MVCFIQGAFMLHLLTPLSFNIAHAHIGGIRLAQHREDIEDIAYWAYDDGWYVSPILETEYKTRVGLFIEKSSTMDIDIEARWVSGTEYGPWLLLENTFSSQHWDLESRL